MAYLLQFDADIVVPYLLGLDLSREGRVNLAAAITYSLRYGADRLRTDPTCRLAPESPYFQVGLVFGDPGRNTIHHLRFVVDDSSTAFGVLRVVYVDDGGPPLPVEED